MPLSIVQVVAAIGDEASGPSYSVPRLSRALAERGNDVTLHVLDWHDTPSVPSVGLRIYPLFPIPRNLQLSTTMLQGLREATKRADIVHNHGLWGAPNVLAWLATLGRRARLIVSPRGVFAPSAMSRSRHKKRVMWLAGQGAAVRAAAGFHATSEAEALDIRRMGLRAPIAIIPNGVDLPFADANEHRPARAQKRLLYLGRIHPIKGLDRLLVAWSKLEHAHPDWELSIIGPDADGTHTAELKSQARELGLARVTFDGARFGQDKYATYALADVYVLPTLTENFGMTIAEALASGVPVVTTRGAPWSGLEREECGAWVEHGAEHLVDALNRLMGLDESARRAMGERGRAWMQRDFAWEGIASKMDATYAWLLGGGPPPAWVQVD